MRTIKSLLSFLIIVGFSFAVAFGAALLILSATGREQDFFCVLFFGSLFVAAVVGAFEE